jgi:hypothetical protein
LKIYIGIPYDDGRVGIDGPLDGDEFAEKSAMYLKNRFVIYSTAANNNGLAILRLVYDIIQDERFEDNANSDI